MAAGPVLFERLDWRPFGIRPVLPIAATQPAGEATRLDSFRAELTPSSSPLSVSRTGIRLWRRRSTAGSSPLPERALPLRAAARALSGLLGGTRELRAAVLLGDVSEERRAIHAALRSLAAGEPASPRARDVVRRALVETLRHGDHDALVRSLDEVLLGLRSAARLAETA